MGNGDCVASGRRNDAIEIAKGSTVPNEHRNEMGNGNGAGSSVSKCSYLEMTQGKGSVSVGGYPLKKETEEVYLEMKQRATGLNAKILRESVKEGGKELSALIRK